MARRIRFGPFEVDVHTHELWKYGTKIRLVGQPFEILAILLSRPGQLVTREELRARLWPGDTYVDFNHGLNAAVNRLREALSDSAEAPRYVETLPRRGYRFIAAIETESPPAPTVDPSSPPEAITNPSEIPVPRATGSETVPQTTFLRRRLTGVLLGTGALLLAVIAGLHFTRVSSGGVLGTYSPVQHIKPLTSLADETSEPSFSADGNQVAFRREAARSEDSGIFIKELSSEQLVQLTKNATDCCPVWSPDGNWIAFSRFVNKEFGIYLAPTPGHQRSAHLSNASFTTVNGEYKLNTGEISPKRGEIAWSPDGKSIAFSGGAGIVLVSLSDSSVRHLTQPPPLAEDWGADFSADGEQLLFVRSRESGFQDEIMTVPTAGGEITRLAAESARILGPPQWSVDGKSIIFASNRGSHPAMWRVSVDVRDSPVEINDSGWYPAISPRGYRLAYQRVTRSLNIWELNTSAPGNEQRILVPATSETDQGPGPQISPDGKKLAYMSDRSGTMEIWVSDRNGSNPIQLSAMGSAGTPRWSPDSQQITFDARLRDGSAIYVVRVQGGTPKELADGDNVANVCPSWSWDGKWIYFASHRSGEWQVWKSPAEGGTPVQVTTQGGHAPFESSDGRFVYYAKTPYANPEIWQVPIEGGMEKLVSPLVRPASWASWSVVDGGIVFAGPSGKGRPVVDFFDTSKHRLNELGSIDTVPFWMGASRDGKTVVFDQPGWQQAQIMLVDNFR